MKKTEVKKTEDAAEAAFAVVVREAPADSQPRSGTRYWVSVEGLGVADVDVRATSLARAKALVRDYVFNELASWETLADEDVDAREEAT